MRSQSLSPTRWTQTVVMVYPVPFGENGIVGGGERFAIEVAKAMARLAPTRLVTFAESASTSVLDGLEIRIRRPFSYVRGLRQNPVNLGFLADLWAADIIHCHSWHTVVTDLCVIFARATGRPVFVTDVGGGGSVSLASRVPLARAVDGFLPLSHHAARLTPHGGHNVEVIYGGVDLQRFRPGPGHRDPKLVFVGRLMPHKGLDFLIEAFPPPGRPDVLLRVIGRPYDSGYYDYLRRLAVGKRVEFVVDADDVLVAEELRTATVAALPSVYRTRAGVEGKGPELFGLAAAEAMACATPVVTTAVASLPEVVADGETGWVVPPNDVGALRHAVEAAFSHPARTAALGAAARRRVEARFTWEAVARRCLAGYEAVRPSRSRLSQGQREGT